MFSEEMFANRPERLSGAFSFLKKNGLSRLIATSRTKAGVKRFDDIEITYVPTALFAAAQDLF